MNTSPALFQRGAYLTATLPRLIEELIQIAVDPTFPPPTNTPQESRPQPLDRFERVEVARTPLGGMAAAAARAAAAASSSSSSSAAASGGASSRRQPGVVPAAPITVAVPPLLAGARTPSRSPARSSPLRARLSVVRQRPEPPKALKAAPARVATVKIVEVGAQLLLPK